MEKNKFNTKFRKYVDDHVSLEQSDRDFISAIYTSFQNLLGSNNTVQIGSYPRRTAIRPLHDLDILYVLGEWDTAFSNPDPSELLKNLAQKISNEYISPTSYSIKVSVQSHSVSVSFQQNGDEKFAVDIVPAYTFVKNNCGQDTYKVPEVITKKRGQQRKEFFESLSIDGRAMGWINSDPRGYISVARL